MGARYVQQKFFETARKNVLSYYLWAHSATVDISMKSQALLFVHATGLHARCWDVVLNKLPSSLFEKYSVICVDVRGHGQSTPINEDVNWGSFGDDIDGLVRSLNLRRVLACGHSMGGHVVTRLACKDPVTYPGIALIDPVIFAPELYAHEQPTTRYDFVRKRRPYFPSPYDFLTRLSTRPPYNSWHPQVLQDYCHYGLRPTADPQARLQPGQQYELCCAPQYEANVYGASTLKSNNLHALLPLYPGVVDILRAPSKRADVASPFQLSPTYEGLAKCFAAARLVEDRVVSELSHFIPMESPDTAAQLVLRLVANAIA